MACLLKHNDLAVEAMACAHDISNYSKDEEPGIYIYDQDLFALFDDNDHL